MASFVILLIGFLFLVLGVWILFLRGEGFLDYVSPRKMSIGQITVDGQDSKGYAELLRARFDHHFRPVAITSETGFLEMVSLDAPQLFQAQGLSGTLDNVTIEISGVDVAKVVQFMNQLAKPDQWLIEGDFQTHSGRALLALRFSRGDRLIRTWYLERVGESAEDKSVLLEQLIDDAIFQLVYDFGNEAEKDPELRKWRSVVGPPGKFPNRAALAAYYEGCAALGNYYAQGAWKDLDQALEHLQTLRGLMPENVTGLRLLALALAEKRRDSEAIHVYEQARLLLLRETKYEKLPSDQRRHVSSIDLLKAASTAKLDTWQSTHDSIAQLLPLAERLGKEVHSAAEGEERTFYQELLAHSYVQLAYSYALYLSHLRDYTVADVLGSKDAPDDLRVDDEQVKTLQDKNASTDDVKKLVRERVSKVVDAHRKWLGKAAQTQADLEQYWKYLKTEGERRRRELDARLHLIAGYAHYRTAEWEPAGQKFESELYEAAKHLSEADAAHPNHYLVLQLLGLVYSEPRQGTTDLSIAEQYFERAIRANPFDHYGHELLAALLLRRAANRGVDLMSRSTIEKGAAQAQQAITQRDTSGEAHLLRAESSTMLLEIERDEAKRRDLETALTQSIEQAARFLPQAFGHEDPDLTWVRAVAAARQSKDGRESQNAQRFQKSKDDALRNLHNLSAACKILEARWMNQQRLLHIRDLDNRANRLKDEIVKATAANWRGIRIPFL